MRSFLLLCAIAFWSSAVAWSLAPRLPRVPRTLLSAKAKAPTSAEKPNEGSKLAPKKKPAQKGKAPSKSRRTSRPRRQKPKPQLDPPLANFMKRTEEMNYMEKYDELLELIECFSAQDQDMPDEFLERKLFSEYAPTVSVFNHVLDEFADNPISFHGFRFAFQVAEKMKHYGVEPNLHTYESLMMFTARVGDPFSEGKNAIELLQEVKDRSDLEPTLRMYDDAITACRRDMGMGVQALELTQEKQGRADFQPKLTTDDPALAAFEEYTAAYDEYKKEDMVEVMIACGKTPTVGIFNHVIDTIVREGMAFRSFQVAKMMKDNGVRPNLHTYESLLTACVSDFCLNRNDAIELMQEVKDRPDLDPTSRMYEHAITQCVGQSPPHPVPFYATRLEAEWALTLFEEGIGDPKIEMTLKTYYSAIAACAALGKSQRGLELLREVEARHDFDPALNSYDSAYFTFSSDAFEACAKSGDYQRAMNLYCMMKATDIAPTVVAYAGCINACTKAGHYGRASCMFSQAEMESVDLSDRLEPFDYTDRSFLVNLIQDDFRTIKMLEAVRGRPKIRSIYENAVADFNARNEIGEVIALLEAIKIKLLIKN